MKRYFTILFSCAVCLQLQAQTPINHDYHNLLDENVGHKSTYVQRSAFNDELLSLYAFNNGIAGQEVDLSLGSNSEIFVCDSVGGYIIFRTHDSATLETNQTASIRISFASSSGASNIPVRHCGDLLLADVSLWPDRYVVTDDNVLIQNTHEEKYLNCLLKLSTAGDYIDHREIRHNQGSLHRTLRYPQVSHRGLLTGPFNGDVEVYDFAFKDTISVIRNQVSEDYYQPEFSLFTEVFDVSEDTLHTGLIEGNGAMKWHGSIAKNDVVLRLISLSGSIDLDPQETENWYDTPENEQHLVLAAYTTQGELEWVNLIAKVGSAQTINGVIEAQIINVGNKVLIDHWFSQLSSVPDFTGTISVFAGANVADEDTMQLSGFFNNSARYASVLNPELNEVTAVYAARVNGEEGGQSGTYWPIIIPYDNEHFVFNENFNLQFNPDWVVERIYPDQYQYQSAVPTGAQHEVNYHIIPVNSLTGHQSYVLHFNGNPSDTWQISMTPTKGNIGDVLFSGIISGYVTFEFPEQEPVLVMADFGLWDGIFMKCSKLTTSISETNTSFTVYPNPSHDRLFVQSAIAEQLSFGIFSIDGKLISNGVIISGGSIPVADLSPGTYLLRLEQNAEPGQSVRFVKF